MLKSNIINMCVLDFYTKDHINMLTFKSNEMVETSKLLDKAVLMYIYQQKIET